MKKKTSLALDLFLAVAIGCSIFGLLSSPKDASGAAQDGINLCLNIIIPSLFPFFVMSTLIVELGLAEYLGRAMENLMRPLFGVSGACSAAVALGFIGGYPVGAKTAISLYEKGTITKTEAERLLSFCNNSGPAFILGAVGVGIFASSKVGWILYLTHAAASLTVGLFFKYYRHGSQEAATSPVIHSHKVVKLSRAFVSSVSSSFQSILGICAFVIFFTVAIRMLHISGILPMLASLLTPFGLTENAAQRILTGLIEITSGLWSLQGAEAKLAGTLSMAAFMLGWAGVSVHCQVLSFIGESGLSSWTYVLGKIMHGSLSAVYTYVILRFFDFELPASNYLAEQISGIARMDFESSLLFTLLVTLGLCAGIILLTLLKFLLPKPKKFRL